MINLSKPAAVDLDAFHHEINTNFTSVVNLALKFSAVLLEKQTPTALIVTGTHLSIVPSVAMPAYSCSKAALHAFMDCLRRQNQGRSCKFIEISAPAVQSKLHAHLIHVNLSSVADQSQPSFTITWATTDALLVCRWPTLSIKSTRSCRDQRSILPSAFRWVSPKKTTRALSEPGKECLTSSQTSSWHTCPFDQRNNYADI